MSNRKLGSAAGTGKPESSEKLAKFSAVENLFYGAVDACGKRLATASNKGFTAIQSLAKAWTSSDHMEAQTRLERDEAQVGSPHVGVRPRSPSAEPAIRQRGTASSKGGEAPEVVTGRRDAHPSFSSGGGLGIHQPGSMTRGFALQRQPASGRARDRAICPAVARSLIARSVA